MGPARHSPWRIVNARALAVLLLLFGLVAGGVSAAAPSIVGIAAAVVNDVRIRGAAARQFTKATLRQRVALADQVQTGEASRLQLLLLDKSKFTVGPNARLTIDRFVYDPSGSAMSASVAKGAFRFMSGRTGGSKDRSIKSPAATIGIRGTLLDGVVGEEAVAIARGEREIRGNIQHDPATATLVVLRGPGPGKRGNDAIGAVDVSAAGETVVLDRPLQAAYVPRVGAPPIAFTISSPGVARLNDLLLEPREVLYDPDAPGQPFMPPSGRDPPYYDYPPPPGGFDDGPRPRGPGGYGPGGIPGLDGFPTTPDRPRPDRPGGRSTQSLPQGTTQAPAPTSTPGAGPTSTPPSTTGQGGNQPNPPNDPPRTGPSPSPNDPPRPGRSPSPNDRSP